ncbi:MAG: phospholipase D-like domain-containing protein [Saprospiraceae bacterium]|nr:hypothetical protein [Saprospiraceae bacterium]MCB9343223.1 hypothetical protein [Lewinellaceae bacterium]
MHKAQFENCAQTVIEFLNSAQNSLEVCICWFTHPDIFKACFDACKRNVRVTIILNFDNINFHPKGLNWNALERVGAKMLVYPGPELLHYKFAIVDQVRVLSGSYNWTRVNQRDHLVCIADSALATQFSRALYEVELKSFSLSKSTELKPRPVNFQQLFKPVFSSPADLKKQILAGRKCWLTKVRSGQEWEDWIYNQKYILVCSCSLNCLSDSVLHDKEIFKKQLESGHFPKRIKWLLIRYCFRLNEGDVLVALNLENKILGAGIVAGRPAFQQNESMGLYRFVQWLDLKSPVLCKRLGTKTPQSDLRPFRGSAFELIDMVIASEYKNSRQPFVQ